MRALPFLSLVCATFLACSKGDRPERMDLGTDYFPLGTGRWIEYTVDSVWKNATTAVHDSINYELRELQHMAFNDLEGRPAQQLRRLRRDDTGGWNIVQNVWWQTADTRRAERSEDGQRRVKLLFPPATGQYWNTNATNTGRPYELTYLEVDVPWSVNGLHFDHTVLVKTTYPNNLVVAHTYYERYAKGVGLVYRQVDSTNTQSNGVSGHWYRQVITAHGQ